LNKDFIDALDELEKEKGIPKQQLLEAVQRALVSAYKGRSKSTEDNVAVEIDAKTGEIQILHYKTVVEEVEDPNNEVSLAEMLEFDSDYEVGDVAVFPVEVEGLGRIAAQTAKQVVFQTVRDIERTMVYDEYISKLNEIVTGNVQRVSNDTVFVSVGRTEGLMAPSEQVRDERYHVNNRMKFFIVDVRKSQKGPQIFLSRSHPNLVKSLFELEVPEIQDGIVVIESIAREAGSRTKIAVNSADENVDPVGACVGNRGTRVQAVVDELYGEKIDIIPWSDNIEDNIMNALSPSKVEKVMMDEEENSSTAIVPDYQLSLAIGKEGQNVRLAAKLCGIKIDIKSHSQYYSSVSDSSSIADALDEDGYLNPEEFIEQMDAENGQGESKEADKEPEEETDAAEQADESAEEEKEAAEDTEAADESASEEKEAAEDTEAADESASEEKEAAEDTEAADDTEATETEVAEPVEETDVAEQTDESASEEKEAAEDTEAADESAAEEKEAAETEAAEPTKKAKTTKKAKKADTGTAKKTSKAKDTDAGTAKTTKKATKADAGTAKKTKKAKDADTGTAKKTKKAKDADAEAAEPDAEDAKNKEEDEK